MQSDRGEGVHFGAPCGQVCWMMVVVVAMAVAADVCMVRWCVDVGGW